MSRPFFRNAKIEGVQENRSEHAKTCALIDPSRRGLFGVSEAAVYRCCDSDSWGEGGRQERRDEGNWALEWGCVETVAAVS
jgi:hypothetical protein